MPDILVNKFLELICEMKGNGFIFLGEGEFVEFVNGLEEKWQLMRPE